jgi:hypothetical protein
VIYDPENPSEVEVHSIIQLRILPFLFIIVGVVGIVLASLDYLEVINLLE